ncbi:DUF2934 domain-containing protein [Novosphingobium sp. RD2P27]|uniref:DUF2934 domain-containing protein n=1 Tax=Novosphingobium kalidii TaxID=3230299 RepID=A0ABV2CX78_9SPHN
MSDRENRIRERAFALWLEQGSPHGRDQEHWDQACSEIDEEDRTGAATSASNVGTPKPASRKGEKKASSPAPAKAADNAGTKTSSAKPAAPKSTSAGTAPAAAAKQPPKRRPRAKA